MGSHKVHAIVLAGFTYGDTSSPTSVLATVTRDALFNLPLGSATIIDYTIQWLTQGGIHDITLCVTDSVPSSALSAPSLAAAGVHVWPVPDALTADSWEAITTVMDERKDADDFLVVDAMYLTNLDPALICETHAVRGAGATVLLDERRNGKIVPPPVGFGGVENALEAKRSDRIIAAAFGSAQTLISSLAPTTPAAPAAPAAGAGKPKGKAKGKAPAVVEDALYRPSDRLVRVRPLRHLAELQAAAHAGQGEEAVVPAAALLRAPAPAVAAAEAVCLPPATGPATVALLSTPPRLAVFARSAATAYSTAPPLVEKGALSVWDDVLPYAAYASTLTTAEAAQHGIGAETPLLVDALLADVSAACPADSAASPAPISWLVDSVWAYLQAATALPLPFCGAAAGVLVAAGAVVPARGVSNAVVLPDAIVEEGAVIKYSVIGAGARVAAGTKLANCAVAHDAVIATSASDAALA